MADDPFVAVRDGSPRLRVGALLTTGVGALLWAYWQGLVEFLDSVGSGFFGSVDDVAAFLTGRGGLVDRLVGMGVGAADVAWQSNAAFVMGFGAFAQLVAVLEVALVMWVLVEYGPLGIRLAWGAFS